MVNVGLDQMRGDGLGAAVIKSMLDDSLRHLAVSAL